MNGFISQGNGGNTVLYLLREYKIFNFENRTVKKAQQVQALATKLDYLSVILGTSTCVPCYVDMGKHIQQNTYKQTHANTHIHRQRTRERETGTETGEISVENSLMVYLKSYMFITTYFIYFLSSQLRTTKANTCPCKVLIEMFTALLLQQQILTSSLSILQETHKRAQHTPV